MDLKELHKSVVVGGSAEVERATGLIDRVLSEEPLNRRARIYKGSLLTVLGEDEFQADKSRIYIETGLAIMDVVLKETPATSPYRVEFDYIYATTIAMLCGREARVDEAADLLTQLVTQEEFSMLSEFEQVRALSLSASVCKRKGMQKLAKSLFQRASAIDRNLASTIYANWLERVTP